MTNSSNVLLNCSIMIPFTKQKVGKKNNYIMLFKDKKIKLFLDYRKNNNFTCINDLHIVEKFQSTHQNNVVIWRDFKMR